MTALATDAIEGTSSSTDFVLDKSYRVSPNSDKKQHVGILIPLLGQYATSAYFDRIITAKRNHPKVPVVAVINPSNSALASQQDKNWNGLIRRLKKAGVLVIGLVDTTDYGNADAAGVPILDRMGKYKALYPAIDGFYFSHVSNQLTDADYYKGVAFYAKNILKASITAADFGGNEPPAAFEPHFDILVSYSGVGLPSVASKTSPKRAALAYGLYTLNESWISQNCPSNYGWIYMNAAPESDPTPWDKLPHYFEELVSYIDYHVNGNEPKEGLTSQPAVDKWGLSRMYYTKKGCAERYIEDGAEEFDNEYVELWSPFDADLKKRTDQRWLNVEMTAYFSWKARDALEPEIIEFFSRGGSTGPTASSVRVGYDIDAKRNPLQLFYAAKQFSEKAIARRNFAKEGDGGGFRQSQLEEKWFGLKAIVYNNFEIDPYDTGDNRTHVFYELYADFGFQNNWELIFRTKDGDHLPTGDGKGWSIPQDDPRFVEGSVPLDMNSKAHVRHRDDVINTPGGFFSNSADLRYGRNCSGIRLSKGIKCKYFSVREIDASKPVGSGAKQPYVRNSPLPGVIATTRDTGLNDKFGIRMLYFTKDNGDEWFMDMANPAGDPRTNQWSGITKNSDGSWNQTDTQVRQGVKQKNGYNQSKTFDNAQDHSKCDAQGFMQDSQDWRHTEITGVVKIRSGSGDNFAWYSRGGRHTDPKPWCEGSSIKIDLGDDGRVRFAKEQWHVNYAFTNWTSGTGGSIKGKFVSFKGVCYNKVVDGKTVVKMENWVDENNTNDWVLMQERTDNGGFAASGDEDCKGAHDQLIRWGGPMAVYRWDTFTSVDFKWFSVREIDPLKTGSTPPPPPPPASCASP